MSFHINHKRTLEQLLAQGQHNKKLVEIIRLKPLEPPYPRSYDPKARCDYLGKAVGHSTKRCSSLKQKVQDLLDGGLLSFQDQGPNVQNNPLLTYKGVAINAISHENKDEAEGASKREREEGAAGCTVDSANRVEEEAHSSLLNEAESTSVVYIEENDNTHPKLLIIYYNSASQPRVSFIIQVSSKSIYNNNAVPWRYPTGETTTPLAIKEDPLLEVTNIAGIEGVTRSGRIFALENLQNKDLAHVKKDKAAEVPRRIVTKGEAIEFLKLIYHNEYEILDQLHKTSITLPHAVDKSSYTSHIGATSTINNHATYLVIYVAPRERKHLVSRAEALIPNDMILLRDQNADRLENR
ncbi:hypothetical protein CR513_18344, partial [Mucuna pruriens]